MYERACLRRPCNLLKSLGSRPQAGVVNFYFVRKVRVSVQGHRVIDQNREQASNNTKNRSPSSSSSGSLEIVTQCRASRFLAPAETGRVFNCNDQRNPSGSNARSTGWKLITVGSLAVDRIFRHRIQLIRHYLASSRIAFIQFWRDIWNFTITILRKFC